MTEQGLKELMCLKSLRVLYLLNLNVVHATIAVLQKQLLGLEVHR